MFFFPSVSVQTYGLHHPDQNSVEMCTFVCKVHDESPAQQGGLKVGESVCFFIPAASKKKEKKWWKTGGADVRGSVEPASFCSSLLCVGLNFACRRPFGEVQI